MSVFMVETGRAIRATRYSTRINCAGFEVKLRPNDGRVLMFGRMTGIISTVLRRRGYFLVLVVFCGYRGVLVDPSSAIRVIRLVI